MPRFEIRGTGAKTGRRRVRTYSARNEAAAKILAEADGMIVEAITVLPEDPPTEAQLAYARDLGIPIPGDADIRGLSCLIDMKLENDKLATGRHREFAELYGIDIPQFIGKKRLFDMIQAVLIQRGKEKEMLSWFSYRVYRHLVEGKPNADIETPDDPVIRRIALGLMGDEAVVRSVRRYAGRELIWFGRIIDRNGVVHEGGSDKTVAFKRTSALLQDILKLPARSGTVRSSKRGHGSTKVDLLRADNRTMLIGISLIIGGCFFSVALGSSNSRTGSAIGGLIFLLGLILFLVGRLNRWWHSKLHWS